MTQIDTLKASRPRHNFPLAAKTKTKRKTIHFNLSEDRSNSKMSLTCVGERDRKRMGQSEEKPYPGREEGGGGRLCPGEKRA